jgi:uncharacterized protein (DUF58 family)
MPLKKFKAKLIPEIKELNLFIKKNLLSTALSGELLSSLKGRGIEFEEFRDYSISDDASRIDWRASKKAQRTLVREYKLEINFNIFFLIDVSESMLFASTPKLKCEYAAEVVTSLYYGIIQTGNAVGFALFNEKLIKMFKPLLGKKQFYSFTKEISNPENYGGKKDLAKALQQTIGILDTKALIFVISDFIGMNENWLQYMKIVAEKHELIGIAIRDPRDNKIPKESGQLILGDPYSNECIYVDANQYSKIYEEENLKQAKLLKTLFEHNKSNIVELTTDIPYLNPLLQFFKKSGGRWR